MINLKFYNRSCEKRFNIQTAIVARYIAHLSRTEPIT